MRKYLLAHVGNGLLDVDHVHGLHVADDRSDQTLLGSDCNADVYVIAVDNGVAAVRSLDRCVNASDVAHGQDGGAREGAHEAELHAGLLENLILV
jgi:hypothetical protein